MEERILTPSHYRSIQSLIVVVDDKLRDIEALVCLTDQASKADRILEVVNDLSADEKDLLLQKITAIRKTTRLFANAYGIKSKQDSLKRTLTTKAAFLWEELSGATFNRLLGYGAIDESMRDEYEDYTNLLTAMAGEMMHINANHDDK